MPITVNDGGVLRRLGTVSANDGGVIRNLGTVSTNDGGVIRTVHSANKVEITGITPLVTAEDHIVIVNSGTFKLTAPAGTRIIVGNHGSKCIGGYVAEHTLIAPVKNAQCTATICDAAFYQENATKLVIAGATYGCGKVNQVIQSKWGPIGGEGGYIDNVSYRLNRDPTGAGGGAGGYTHNGSMQYGTYGQKGGNNGGYGNFGGNGGRYQIYNAMPTDGASGAAGTHWVGPEEGDYSDHGHYFAPGGGGGYAAGGGEGYYNYLDGWDDEYFSGGEAGAGIIVIEW